MQLRTISIGLLLLAACARDAAPPPAPPATPAPGPSAAPRVAPARSYQLTLPERWTRRDEKSFETLTDPDGEVTLRIVESREPDLVKAIANAWKAASPGMKLKERQRVDGAPSERFAAQLVVTYSDDGDEHVAQAIALQHAKDEKRVYVLLIEGPTKSVRKRGAELNRIISSLEVEGVKRLEVDPAKRKPFDAARRDAFFAFVEEARALLDVPGVAVAVVTPEGVHTKGFGKRALSKNEPVDADTQFMIGSITKSFSTLLLGTLVDEGKLTWETPAKQAHADFRVADPDRSEAVRIQHLFCACVGAPRQDMELLFEFRGKGAPDMFAQVAQMKLTTGFGETFQYNNQLTAVGGFIAGHVAYPGQRDLGAAYGRALRERVLDKVGMKDTVLEEAKVRARRNHAMPHHLDWSRETEELDIALERFAIPVAPAGALWSTANDMAKYLQLQLARGMAGDARVISEANLARTQTAQIKVSERTGYGMGWLVGKDTGLRAIEHSGGTMGFNTDLVFFPEIGVGMFIAANRSPGGLAGAVRARLIEVLFDLEPKVKAELAHDVREMHRLLGEAAAKVSGEPVPDTLLGRYQSKQLGSATLARRGKVVELDVGEWRSTVGVFLPAERPQTLILTSGVLQGATLQWSDKDGTPELTLKHSQTDYVFRRL